MITRRTFLKVSSVTVGGASAGLQAGCGNPVVAAPLVEAALQADDKIRIVVPMYPDLEAPGGAITIQLTNLPEGDRFTAARKGILLIHRGSADDQPEFVATQSECPHLGCPLGYSTADLLIECPCHSSRFLPIADPATMGSCIGDVQHGPALQPLTAFLVQYQPLNKTVTIDLRQILACGNELPAVTGGTVTIPFADFPQLAMPGGSVLGTPPGLGDRLLVIRKDSATAAATSGTCTHRACAVGYAQGSGNIECPCHGSIFATDGAVIEDPGTPIPPLRTYPAVVEANQIVVTVS